MGSIGEIAINLGETVQETQVAPPSLMKATPTLIASNQHDVCPVSFSNVDDATIMPLYQNKGIYNNYSTPPNKDPPEGKRMITTAATVTSTTSKN